MRFARVRSGLHETSHDVAVVALDSSGSEVFASGDIGRPFFYRSAVKPFQAAASERAGIQVSDEQLAVICSSHGGFPVHVGLVRTLLEAHGRSIEDLRCPRAVPLNRSAEALDARIHGPRTSRLLHNCSGKHAGWIAASAAAGWPIATYLEPDHPVQRRSFDILAEASGVRPTQVGVDGCGAPTAAGTVGTLARAFHNLGNDPGYGRIASAMTAYPAVVSDNLRPDGRFGIIWSGPSKGGAEGVFAATRNGITIVAKAVDGSGEIAVAAVATVARLLDGLGPAMDDPLDLLAHPLVLGGGRPVGRLELVDS